MAELLEFSNVCKGCLSADNELRKRAEEVYHKSIAATPEKFYTLSTRCLLNSADAEVRTFCAVMMRQYLGVLNPTWNEVSPATQESVKAALLDLFRREADRSIRKQVSNCVGALAARCLSEEGKWTWEPLLPLLMEMSRSPHAILKESVLDILAIMGEFCVSVLQPHLRELRLLLLSTMQDREPSVRLSSLRATISILLSLEDADRVGLKDLVPTMFQLLGHAYQSKDDALVKSAIEVLVNLARLQPAMLRTHLKPVIGALVQMAADRQIEEETRRMSYEFLLTLAETGKGMVRKLADYAKAVIPLTFQYLLEIGDNKAWEAFEEEDADSDQQTYVVGTEGIERLSYAVGGKVFLQIAWPIIEAFLAADWQKRHAALMAIAKMADGCEKLIKKELPKFVRLIIPFVVKEKHVRVQWAAVNALAQLATDFQPDFQAQFHDPVLPALCRSLNPKNHPRLIVHAALCIVDFLNGAPEESLTPHLEGLLGALVVLLKSAHLKIQEAALTAVTAAAQVADEKFTPHYATFMPGVMGILRNAREEKHKHLRGKAMECIGVVAKAVGPALFVKDCEPIMEILITTLKEGLSGDDPQYEHVVQALARICQCLGEAFKPFLPHIIPSLLKSASIRDACLMDDGAGLNKYQGKEGYETVTVDLRQVGNQRITINTSLMQEQAMACNMLFQFADTLKETFFPYVQQTAQALIPLIPYLFNERVRMAAISAAPALLTCAKAHAKKEGKESPLVREMWAAMCPQLLEALAGEFRLQTINNVMEHISDSILAVGRLTPEQMRAVSAVIKEFWVAAGERREQRDAKTKSPDFDEQEMEQLEEENEKEDEHLTKMYYITSAMVKGANDAYLPIFDEVLFPVVFPTLAPAKSTGERCAALCILGDIIAFGGPRAGAYVEKFFPITIQYSKDPDVEVRQAAVFGVGACGKSYGARFLPLAENALKVLVGVITAADSKEGKNPLATDCAIGSVGKICRFVLNTPGPPQEAQAKILPMWLSWLPCLGDEEEGQIIHEFLCDFLEGNNPAVWGPSNKNIPKILSIFAQIADTDWVTPETKRRVVAIWTKIRTSLTAPQLTAALGTLPEEQQTTLRGLS